MSILICFPSACHFLPQSSLCSCCSLSLSLLIMPTQRAERRPRAFLDLVVTPDSIPQFIIPRLGSSTRSLGPLSPPSRSVGELYCGDQEPGTRLAMSLPHLRRITTPYGFLALGESPCVYRKESLFFGGLKEEGWGTVKSRLSSPELSQPQEPRVEQPVAHRLPSAGSIHLIRGSSCSSLPSPQSSPPTRAGKTSRSFSWDLSAPSRHLRLGVPEGKTRLQRLIKKHLSKAQKKRRARVSSNSGGEDEENSSSN